MIVMTNKGNSWGHSIGAIYRNFAGPEPVLLKFIKPYCSLILEIWIYSFFMSVVPLGLGETGFSVWPWGNEFIYLFEGEKKKEVGVYCYLGLK